VNDPADLRARIASALRLAAECVARGDDIGHDAALAAAEVFRMRLTGHVSHLPSRSADSTVMGTEMASPESMTGEEKRRFGIAKALASDHPFPQAVIASGSNVTKWAKSQGLKRDEVKSWYSRLAPRPIPKKYARLIAKTFGLEPSKKLWPAGVKDE
jgi:hypothetical protein